MIFLTPQYNLQHQPQKSSIGRAIKGCTLFYKQGKLQLQGRHLTVGRQKSLTNASVYSHTADSWQLNIAASNMLFCAQVALQKLWHRAESCPS